VFIQKVNATEVSDEINGKGTPLTLFVFTDSLEVSIQMMAPMYIDLLKRCRMRHLISGGFSV
jgi:hypothetical protein